MNPSFTLCRGLVLAIALSAGLFANAGRSAIVINPDGTFDNPAPFTPTSLDATWQDRYPEGTVNSWLTWTGREWTNINHEAVTVGSGGAQKLAEVFAVPLAATNETGLEFSFDWRPSPGATGGQLNLKYWILGWKVNSAPSNGDPFFVFTNWQSSANNYGVSNLNGNATVYSLDPSALAGVQVTGIDGVTTNITANITLPVPKLGDLDFIGIRFAANASFTTGATLDNVILVAVPEPSLLALAGTGLLALGLACRRKPSV